MNNKFFDLTFDKLASGAIRLKQSAFDEDSVIDLHPAQLRHIAESFGLVTPSYPADELTKRLALQLCTVLKELADECHRSHWLEMTYARLDAWCSAIPDAFFPYDLWDDDEQPAQAATPSKALAATAATPSAPKPQPSPIAESDGQLGLPV